MYIYTCVYLRVRVCGRSRTEVQKMDMNNTRNMKLKNNNLIFSLKKIAVCQGQEEAGQATQGH